jgi:predicted TIM-barrel fold metal-dependent hydrolase
MPYPAAKQSIGTTEDRGDTSMRHGDRDPGFDHAGTAGHGCACGFSRRHVMASMAAFAASTVLTGPAARAQTQTAPTSRVVDTHHHFFPPPYLEPLKTWSDKAGLAALWPAQQSWTVARAIEDMERNNVATAMLSISTPGIWFGQAEAARKMARLCNDYGAEMVRSHPGRFGLFASVPMPDVEGTLREIDYAFDVLKADGIGFMTSYGDKWPGDPAFAPVFAELNRRKTVAYFHPLAPNCCAGMLIPGVTGSPVEYMFDTTRAVVSLLVNGTLAKMKDLRFLFSHAGGTIPMVAGRIVNAFKGRKDIAEIAPEGIDAEFRRLYYDTANSFYAPTIAALTSYVPASQVVFGTDFPYLTTGQNLEGLRKLALTPAQMTAITRDNAVRLLPRLQS